MTYISIKTGHAWLLDKQPLTNQLVDSGNMK